MIQKLEVVTTVYSLKVEKRKLSIIHTDFFSLEIFTMYSYVVALLNFWVKKQHLLHEF